MYCIVLGAEPEGQKFIQMALENDHEVTLSEEDEDKARQVLKEKVTVPGTTLAERSRSQNSARTSPSTPLRGRLQEKSMRVLIGSIRQPEILPEAGHGGDFL